MDDVKFSSEIDDIQYVYYSSSTRISISNLTLFEGIEKAANDIVNEIF